MKHACVQISDPPPKEKKRKEKGTYPRGPCWLYFEWRSLKRTHTHTHAHTHTKTWVEDEEDDDEEEDEEEDDEEEKDDAEPPNETTKLKCGPTVKIHSNLRFDGYKYSTLQTLHVQWGGNRQQWPMILH